MNSFLIVISRLALEQKRDQLAANGIVLSGDSGLVEHSGAKLALSYEEPDLTVTIIDKPWWVTASTVEKKVRELLSV